MTARHPQGARADRGAGTLEYAGLAAVVAIVVGTVIATSTEFGSKTGMLAEHAACEVGSATGWTDGCESTPLMVTQRMTPTSCSVSSSGERKEGDLSIAVVDLGIGRGVEVVEVQNEDGSTHYLVTVNNDGEAGVGIGAGGELGTGKSKGKSKSSDDKDGLDASLQVDLTGKGIYVDGTTYKVDTKAEAEALAQALYDDGNDGADGQSPHIESTTWAGEGRLSGDAGLSGSYGREGDDGLHRDGEFEVADLAGSGSARHSWQSSYNHETGETTYLTSWNGTLGGNASVAGHGPGGEWGWGSTIAITRDKDNNITGVQVIQVQERSGDAAAGGGVDEKVGDTPEGDAPDKRNGYGGSVNLSAGETEKTVTTIDLTVTDANRGTVESWLGDQTNWGNDWMPTTPFGTYGWDPTTESTDPMVQLLYKEAQITKVVTVDGRTSEEIGASIKWGLKFGASYTHTSTDGEVVSAEYAGPPAEGRRGWKVMDVCF